MGYDYYCFQCGKRLNQEIVLFDMQYLLTQDTERTFNILKYRFDQTQFKKLFQNGEKTENSYFRCRLTLAEILACMSNKNNLDDSEIANLTLQMIRDYTNPSNFLFASKSEQKNEDDYGSYEDDESYDSNNEAEEENTAKAPAQEYVKPAPILALENKSKALVDELYVRDLLMSDLSVLQSIFEENDYFEFQIRSEPDTDNEGNEVLCDYNAIYRGNMIPVKARVCCKCGHPVFRHAGTAKHQAVGFIGNSFSGKTSTILALTDYATFYMNTGVGHANIWDGCQMIPQIIHVEELDRTDRKRTDQKQYAKGIAPDKTKASKPSDAYSVTLLLKNKVEGNKSYILTLIDLPGELCMEDGAVNRRLVEKNFPVALASDAFVACFDSKSLKDPNTDVSPNQLVADICNQTDQFQRLRAMQNSKDTYVPTMVLFTKCEELENDETPEVAPKPLTPLESTYMFMEEKRKIESSNVYRLVSSGFATHGALHKAYYAMLRCSPFGYEAPTQNKVDKGETYHPPKPKNIQLLMKWLLSVTGCIPTEASFRRNKGDIPLTLNDFFITRPQLRSEVPGILVGTGLTHQVEESLARCALFENPGVFDRKFVPYHDRGAFVLKPLEIKSMMHRNGNAD